MRRGETVPVPARRSGQRRNPAGAARPPDCVPSCHRRASGHRLLMWCRSRHRLRSDHHRGPRSGGDVLLQPGGLIVPSASALRASCCRIPLGRRSTSGRDPGGNLLRGYDPGTTTARPHSRRRVSGHEGIYPDGTAIPRRTVGHSALVSCVRGDRGGAGLRREYGGCGSSAGLRTCRHHRDTG
jgi:hypothetical protein